MIKPLVNMNIKQKKIVIIGVLVLIVVAVAAIWYIFTVTFSDINDQKPKYSVKALDLINEFKKNDSIANKKYAEKIIAVTGLVTEVESADTTVNIKLGDTTNGSYAIFAFQRQHLADAKTIKKGDSISIKGSCSGGAYSEILETEFITFKRCAIIK